MSVNSEEMMEVKESLKFFSRGRGCMEVQGNKITGYEPYIENYEIELKPNRYSFKLSNDQHEYSASDVEGLINWIEYVYSYRSHNEVDEMLLREELNKNLTLDDLVDYPSCLTKEDKEQLLRHIKKYHLSKEIDVLFQNTNELYHFWLKENTIFKKKWEVDNLIENYTENGLLAKLPDGKLVLFKTR